MEMNGITDRMEERPLRNYSEEEMDPEIRFSTKSYKLETNKSIGSRCSRRSSASISSIIARKRASIESAKVGLHFVKKEADLKIQQAEMESKLLVLKQEKEIAMTETEVKVLEEVSSQTDGRSHENTSLIHSIPVESPRERTENFVIQHTVNENVNSQHLSQRDDVYEQETVYNSDIEVQNRHSRVPSHLNPSAPVYEPTSDLTRFLLKKDLLLSRLTSFNDRPETYAMWKASFICVIDELQVTRGEELDLLIKWLGPESRKYALSLRAANLHDPKAGLQRVWERLEERYGSPEMVENALKSRLSAFPKIGFRDNAKFYELADLLSEIECVKSDPRYASLLAYFDSSSGILPIINKLPYGIQEKWTNHAFRYKERHYVSFPPFSEFARFVREISKIRNDPSFQYDSTTTTMSATGPRQAKSYTSQNKTGYSIQSKWTGVSTNTARKENVSSCIKCPIHGSRHSLNQCNPFLQKSYEEKKEFLRKQGICFKCCLTNAHLAKACEEKIKCDQCGSTRHPTGLHLSDSERASLFPGTSSDRKPTLASVNQNHGHKLDNHPVSKCTQVCGDTFKGKSCAKNVLVLVYPKGEKHKATKMYATIDDQSNSSLCTSELFDIFQLNSPDIPYTLTSCAGSMETSGRRASNLIVESIDGTSQLEIPSLIECNHIPNVIEEIPTPEVARQHSHLVDIADYLLPLDKTLSVQMLIGRDVPEAHHVLDQRTGPRQAPFAQKLLLGWVVVGEMCLGYVHSPRTVNVNKVYTHNDGRSSIFEPCPNNLKLKEEHDEDNIFRVTKDDNKTGTSVEDREFLDIMAKDMYRNKNGKWVAPLPFRSSRQPLPNNRSQALKRAQILDHSLRKNPEKQTHFKDYMQKLLENKYAEEAPCLENGEECWYLPIFGVYHPKKPSQIRVVFDSAAECNGISLNSVLLQGPDLTNDLLGVLLRFRREPIGIMADIRQMFHCFEVSKCHRNYLRFWWYKDNDFDQKLIEYRMTVHVFGNRSSPAVATYGLQRAAQVGEEVFGTDSREFVEDNFYVDDAVTSLPTAEEAIDLLKRTQDSLRTNGNIHLHKIVSNCPTVMKAFPTEDLAKDLKDLHLCVDLFPLQRSLGMLWDVNADMFKFKVCKEEKPFTKRGVLSIVNSIFDPMGFISPVTIEGKCILRDLISEGVEWDEPLPPEHFQKWESWRNSLQSLENLQIPRTLLPVSFCSADNKELHVFTDASESVIAASSYLKTFTVDGDEYYGFVLGKAKVAPNHGHTIPRLELCAAVLGINIAITVGQHLGIATDKVRYHTDSKIVLGYLSNRTRRFSVYVTNRVETIRRHSDPSQWTYVFTGNNPADQATRPVSAASLNNNSWLTGPSPKLTCSESSASLALDTIEDMEIEPEIAVKSTKLDSKPIIGSHRFEKFSKWRNLVRSIARLKALAKSHHKDDAETSLHHRRHPEAEAEVYVVRQVQHEVYRREFQCAQSKTALPRDSVILQLHPQVDAEGLLRIGGRMTNSQLSQEEKYPLIIPGKHHIATLLIRHCHETVHHQGRHLTEGAVRAAGYWITGVKRLVSRVIHECVSCRRLRGKQEEQIMSDLPADRVVPTPPFTNVGVDTFGPWTVVSRRTRGGQLNSKRWALLFTCLTTRAIHIEVIEEMSSSSFINGLRRFISLRGNVKLFRSDRGTNFVGATDDLGIERVNVEDVNVKNFLDKNCTRWIFNPPHSSHMGGVWERTIGIARRILDHMMGEIAPRKVTHEVLSTFMAEVCAIVNGRPIVPVSTDPSDPLILTPSTLLTHKTDRTAWPVEDNSEPIGNLYHKQWKQVQILADIFWKRWRKDYLQTLQTRRKWTDVKPNIKAGDVVLLKDKTAHRNDWQTGRIVDTIPSRDGRIRKATVRVVVKDKPTEFTRPITDMVLLVSNKN